MSISFTYERSVDWTEHVVLSPSINHYLLHCCRNDLIQMRWNDAIKYKMCNNNIKLLLCCLCLSFPPNLRQSTVSCSCISTYIFSAVEIFIEQNFAWIQVLILDQENKKRNHTSFVKTRQTFATPKTKRRHMHCLKVHFKLVILNFLGLIIIQCHSMSSRQMWQTQS